MALDNDFLYQWRHEAEEEIGVKVSNRKDYFALFILCAGFKNSKSIALSRQHEMKLYLKNGAFIGISRKSVSTLTSWMR